eukprot:TRINITY_DN18869_c0_g1_i1.p1 TRINITY_DN18869_c0_g1~~TRINITY_DN18869_c0_g1_i1.p1  ORF type:complete len:362 (+),score=60.63 TRINITY_DN18869_c0_g1_i1:40-1125(+)
MQNGIRHLRHVRIWYRPDVTRCDVWHGGMLQYIQDYLPSFQKTNPEVKIETHTLVDQHEKYGNEQFPKIVGYYLNGTAITIRAWKMDPEGIDQHVYDMRNRCNDVEPRPHQNKVIQSDQESIQGSYTPLLWLKEGNLPPQEDYDELWKEEVKDIAKYVRRKKHHREQQFNKKYFVQTETKKKMEKRWKETVFPYTIGSNMEAVPGRMHLEDTKQIFQESASSPPASALERGGGGFMGGFVSPFSASEKTVMSDGMTGSSYDVDGYQTGGKVPPFAGAPYESGFGDYENFWKNWDLFHYSSASYRPRPKEIPPDGAPMHSTARRRAVDVRVRSQLGKTKYSPGADFEEPSRPFHIEPRVSGS